MNLQEKSQPGFLITATTASMDPASRGQISLASISADALRQAAAPVSDAARPPAASAPMSAADTTGSEPAQAVAAPIRASKQAQSAQAPATFPAAAAPAADTTGDSKPQAAPASKAQESAVTSASPGQASATDPSSQQLTAKLQPLSTGAFQEPDAAAIDQALHGINPQGSASRDLIKQVDKILDTLPWTPPAKLLERVARLSVGPAEVEGIIEQASLQRYVDEVVSVVSRLGTLLHERKSELQAQLIALKLSQHFQMPLVDRMEESETLLSRYRGLQRELAQLVEQGNLEECLGTVACKGSEALTIMECLAECEKVLQELLAKARYMVSCPCICANPVYLLCPAWHLVFLVFDQDSMTTTSTYESYCCHVEAHGSSGLPRPCPCAASI